MIVTFLSDWKKEIRVYDRTQFVAHQALHIYHLALYSKVLLSLICKKNR